jgi:hypothetical protein
METMTPRSIVASTIVAVGLAFGSASHAGGDDPHQAESCPMHAEHQKVGEEARAAEVKARGQEGMGFSQDRTQHHFRLLADGGAIEVAVPDSADAETREQVRHHLSAIASTFAAGDFQLPMFIHGQTPPGVRVMRSRKARIRYSYEDTESGGRVRISTKDRQALAAVHAFLRFQISDHRTGDPMTVQP